MFDTRERVAALERRVTYLEQELSKLKVSALQPKREPDKDATIPSRPIQSSI